MKPDTVTASEIAEFVYCPEAWRLAQVGHQTANRTLQAAGIDHHVAKGQAEFVAGGSILIGRILIALAILTLVALWWFSQ